MPRGGGRVYSFAQRESKMEIPATSSLKRSRTLLNCSREDRIRDGPFKRLEVRSMTFDLATFLEEAGVGRRVVQLQAQAGLLFAGKFG